jgi:uncharacterized protein YeaO (DUF488 family)
MVKIYTGRMWFKGPHKLDITVKGQHPVGRLFAPTWDIVMGHKRGEITDAEYTEVYHSLMVKSYREHHQVWDEILNRKYVVFCCYCRADKFCHRFILAGYFEKLGATYCGEVPSTSKYYR